MSTARSRADDGFAPHPDVTAARERGGTTRATNIIGQEVTLVASSAGARAVHGDPERLRLDAVPAAPGLEDDPEEARLRTAGMLLALDPPVHTRLRRLLTAEFTVRRVRALRPRVAAIVDAALDDLASAGPGADLVSLVALPVPSLVICELLGVPYADRDAFSGRAARLLDAAVQGDERMEVHRANREYMYGLIERHRAEPADDLLSMLVRRARGDGVADDDELVGLANLLLVAGHETTANMISLSTLALLRHPDQLALARTADPATDDGARAITAAVEELLRFLSVVHIGFARRATADVVVDGHPIAAGELVAASLCAANRDPGLREHGGSSLDTLDVTREPGPHLAFGHGIHHCLGAPLARMELEVALPALLRRFPDLALADPDAAPAFRPDSLIYGLDRLPVSW